MSPENVIATDGITAGVAERKERGRTIAALARIEKDCGCYLVPSVTNPRQTKYKVCITGGPPTCTCLDHENRRCKCKHIYAVEYMLQGEQHADGSTTVTEKVTITQTKRTYPQDWPAYNAAQTNEKAQFQVILHDLCRSVPELPVAQRKGPQGRKPIPAADAVFAAVFKVYSTMSARRFTSDLCDAQAKGFISRVPHFNTVLGYLELPELFPVLTDLIIRSSLPLRSVESHFAFDSTGFTACRFVRWYDVKYNNFTSEQQWVKAHIACGVKTNVVTAIEIHDKATNDSPILPSLVETTARNFTIDKASADKGYLSGENYDALANAGAIPFIAFKSNTTGEVGGLLGAMFHFFCYQRDTFLKHYHQRSNVESTVMMIKSKFGDSLRSKTEVAGKNETLAKVLCHNLCCLIHAIYELGIQPEFPALAG